MVRTHTQWLQTVQRGYEQLELADTCPHEHGHYAGTLRMHTLAAAQPRHQLALVDDAHKHLRRQLHHLCSGVRTVMHLLSSWAYASAVQSPRKRGRAVISCTEAIAPHSLSMPCKRDRLVQGRTSFSRMGCTFSRSRAASLSSTMPNMAFIVSILRKTEGRRGLAPTRAAERRRGP